MATRLIIDDFEFANFEIPERIAFGGAQSLSVHKLPGGSRVVDSMGRDDAPLEWSGYFVGADALERARYLDSWRVQGEAHELAWEGFLYRVVIREFRADYERNQHIPYRIVCEVIADFTNPVNSAAEGADLASYLVEPYSTTSVPKGAKVATGKEDLDSSIEDGLATATVGADSLKPSLIGSIAAAIATAKAAIANVQDTFSTVMQGVSSVVNLEMSAISLVQNTVDTALEDITGLQALIENGIGGFSFLFTGDMAGVSTGASVGVSAAATLNQWAVDSSNLATLRQIKSALTVVSKNLNYINGYPNAQQVTVVGGTLSDLALKYYGDATKWTVIAQANNLSDPIITGQKTLTIPPSASTPANSPGGADIYHWIGDDIGLSNTVGAGTALGQTKAQQRILRRLLTNPNDYKWHPGYGAGVLQNVGNLENRLVAIERLIVSQVMMEQGVAATPAPSVTFDVSGDEITANVQYTEQDSNSRQFISFTVAA